MFAREGSCSRGRGGGLASCYHLVSTGLTEAGSQMEKVLMHVAKKERFHLPDEVAAAIIADAQGNLRKAVLVLEALKMQS